MARIVNKLELPSGGAPADSICEHCSQCYQGECCAFQAPHSPEEWIARKGGVTLCEFRLRCKRVLKDRMPSASRKLMWEILDLVEKNETAAWWLKFVDTDEVYQINVELLVKVVSKLLIVATSK